MRIRFAIPYLNRGDEHIYIFGNGPKIMFCILPIHPIGHISKHTYFYAFCPQRLQHGKRVLVGNHVHLEKRKKACFATLSERWFDTPHACKISPRMWSAETS